MDALSVEQPNSETTQPPTTTPEEVAFFYGTLMHPAVLRRVIRHAGDDLQVAPAILKVRNTTNIYDHIE